MSSYNTAKSDTTVMFTIRAILNSAKLLLWPVTVWDTSGHWAPPPPSPSYYCTTVLSTKTSKHSWTRYNIKRHCATRTSKHSCYYDQSVIRACHRSSAPLPLSSQAPTAQEKKPLGKFKSISPKDPNIWQRPHRWWDISHGPCKMFFNNLPWKRTCI